MRASPVRLAALLAVLAVPAAACLPDPGPLYPPPGDGAAVADSGGAADGAATADTLSSGDSGGGGNNDSATPRPDTTAPKPDQGATTTSFSQIYNQVLKPNCGCHDSASHGSGLTIRDVGSAYANLVGKAARSGGPCAGRTLVKSGDSAASVLYHKLNGGGQLCGNIMPRNASKLSAANINLVKRWIDEGAKQ